MACLTINPDLDTERNHHGAAITVSGSSVNPVVQIAVRAAQHDHQEAVLIHLTAEDTAWLELNLGSALGASLRGEEYENTIAGRERRRMVGE